MLPLHDVHKMKSYKADRLSAYRKFQLENRWVDFDEF
jgi:hypothetical protein